MPQSEGPWTVERVLHWTRGYFERKQVDSPRLSAELILAHVMGLPRIKLYTNYLQPLSEPQLAELRDLVKRAGEHEPIAYLTGRAWFFNLELEVGPAVLIPRPDTETLVEQVLSIIRHTPGFETPRILDVCTGSGAIAIAIAHHAPASQLVATDISTDALSIAERNLQRHQLQDRITLLQGDLVGALDQYIDKTPFDLIVSNPPYIPTEQISELPRNVRDYEPRQALDGGADGLELHRRILHQASNRLRPGGKILLEIGYDQQEAALEMIQQYDAYADARVLRDYAGNPRVLTATRRQA